MTQLACILEDLLEGQVLSIMTAFRQYACTNLPREISRGVQKKFGVMVSKTPVKFTSTYGHTGIYYQYRLNNTPYNTDGIKKIKKYLKSQKK